MNTGRAALAGVLALLTLFGPGRAWGQATIVYQPEGMNGSYTLVPETGLTTAQGPLFLPQGPLPPTVVGSAGGQAVPTLGNVIIGFDYLRPFWTFRDFTLAVPAAAAGGFPLLGDTGHTDNHFAFVPRLQYNYQFTDLDFGISASGTFLSLSGRLQRTVTSTNGGIGDLNANSALTIVSANFVEVTREIYLPDLVGKKGSPKSLEDLLVGLSLGTRYVAIDQNYTGSLTNGATPGANISTRYSTQSFHALGLTSAMNLSLPSGQDWVFFSNLRGSVLVGDNRKDSSLTVNVAGQPGISANINQNDTAFVPVFEYEAGVEWGMALADKLRAGDPQPLLTVRVAGVAQYWGGVGPLSAGSSQGYKTSDLFLFGVSVLVGLHR
jgi:hypothetical protein